MEGANSRYRVIAASSIWQEWKLAILAEGQVSKRGDQRFGTVPGCKIPPGALAGELDLLLAMNPRAMLSRSQSARGR
jgi:hypothetical protein